MDATGKLGFYGTDDSTYYVTTSGKVWVVQTDDLRDCPFVVADLPPNAISLDDLDPDDIDVFLTSIQNES